MTNTQIECTKCKSKDITTNNQVNPVQDYSLGISLKVERYPKYKCQDCSNEFNQ